MNKEIVKESFDIRVICLLAIFSILTLIPLGIGMIFAGEHLVTLLIVFVALFIIYFIFGLWSYFQSKSIFKFSYDGIKIIKNKKCVLEIDWNNILSFIHNGFSNIIILRPFSIDILYTDNNKKETLDTNRFGTLPMFKKKYLEIVKLIPNEIISEKPLIIHRNIVELEKAKNKL